ncbi:MAG: flagellar basal body L-ring protein FlgH [Rhodospirillales bacterium]|nr:flagellar basal body L-ring protein FlgH [Rhodospirillales bacterium]
MASPRKNAAKNATLALGLGLTLALGACSNTLDRLSQVGQAPPLTRIENPAAIAGQQPVQLPMPAPAAPSRQLGSLWQPGASTFLKDQRASVIGDIVTVNIEIEDKAEISNSTARSRTAAEDMGASSILGYESNLNRILPEAINPASLIDLDSTGSHEGAGSVNRDEDIELRVAATVTQVLPNGNLVIAGRQEIRVNFELRELQVAGVIRPEDVTSANTIEFDQIAEARIAYGGRGQISDMQQPRYGQQVYDIIWPF